MGQGIPVVEWADGRGAARVVGPQLIPDRYGDVDGGDPARVPGLRLSQLDRERPIENMDEVPPVAAHHQLLGTQLKGIPDVEHPQVHTASIQTEMACCSTSVPARGYMTGLRGSGVHWIRSGLQYRQVRRVRRGMSCPGRGHVRPKTFQRLCRSFSRERGEKSR